MSEQRRALPYARPAGRRVTQHPVLQAALSQERRCACPAQPEDSPGELPRRHSMARERSRASESRKPQPGQALRPLGQADDQLPEQVFRPEESQQVSRRPESQRERVSLGPRFQDRRQAPQPMVSLPRAQPNAPSPP